jgi:hypothetical protein
MRHSTRGLSLSVRTLGRPQRGQPLWLEILAESRSPWLSYLMDPGFLIARIATTRNGRCSSTLQNKQKLAVSWLSFCKQRNALVSKGLPSAQITTNHPRPPEMICADSSSAYWTHDYFPWPECQNSIFAAPLLHLKPCAVLAVLPLFQITSEWQPTTQNLKASPLPHPAPWCSQETLRQLCLTTDPTNSHESRGQGWRHSQAPPTVLARCQTDRTRWSAAAQVLTSIYTCSFAMCYMYEFYVALPHSLAGATQSSSMMPMCHWACWLAGTKSLQQSVIYDTHKHKHTHTHAQHTHVFTHHRSTDHKPCKCTQITRYAWTFRMDKDYSLWNSKRHLTIANHVRPTAHIMRQG